MYYPENSSCHRKDTKNLCAFLQQKRQSNGGAIIFNIQKFTSTTLFQLEAFDSKAVCKCKLKRTTYILYVSINNFHGIFNIQCVLKSFRSMASTMAYSPFLSLLPIEYYGNCSNIIRFFLLTFPNIFSNFTKSNFIREFIFVRGFEKRKKKIHFNQYFAEHFECMDCTGKYYKN